MSLTHRAFLFYTSQFIEDVAPALSTLRSGSARLLYDKALKIAQNSDAKEWILRKAGAELIDIRVKDYVGVLRKKPIEAIVDDAGKLRTCDLGYWLLLVLSQYLKPLGSMGEDFPILAWLLEKIGWEIPYIDLLIHGTPTSTLIDEALSDQPKRLAESDPYWFWVRPAHSQQSGWLSEARAAHLLASLEASRQAIADFDPARFGDHFGELLISIPGGQLDYLKRAHLACDRALDMLHVATDQKLAIYEVVAYA